MSGYTEADIRAGAASQSFQRGAQYYRDGYVSQLARRGNLLTAEVESLKALPGIIAGTHVLLIRR